MKRNFNVVVKDYDGRPHVRPIFKYQPETGLPVIKNGEHEFSHHEPMTLRTYALDALGGRWPKDEITGVDGAARMRVYHKLLMSDGNIEMTNEDGATIITALTNQGRSFVVIDAMQTLINTDPKPVEAKVETPAVMTES